MVGSRGNWTRLCWVAALGASFAACSEEPAGTGRDTTGAEGSDARSQAAVLRYYTMGSG